MIKKFLAILFLFIVAGCASDLNVDIVDNPAPTYNPTPPSVISVKTPHWNVTNNNGSVMYSLSPDDFKSLMQTLQDTSRYIEEDNSLIMFYQGTNTPLGSTTTGK